MLPTSQSNKAYVLIAKSLHFAPADKLLEGTSLSESSLLKQETIDVADAIKIVHNLNSYSYTPNWPTILGKHLGIVTHGPVGYATISAPSVGKALATFVKWYQIRSNTYSVSIIENDENKENEESDECVEITIFDTTGDQGFQEFFFEALMRAFENLIELLIGHPPKGETKLYFKTLASNRKHLMEAEFASQLCFASPQNKLVVPKKLWFSPSPLYDKDSYEFNLRKCQQLLEELDIQGRIDLMIRKIIRQHFERAIISKASESMPPSLAELCEVLHLTERTLIRRLKELDTAYKKILEAERRKFAVQLLADAKYTVFNVADILGYRESANFCRAFKVWFKQSPTAYRRNPLSLE
jgi:AraC-like DNA-binding protein